MIAARTLGLDLAWGAWFQRQGRGIMSDSVTEKAQLRCPRQVSSPSVLAKCPRQVSSPSVLAKCPRQVSSVCDGEAQRHIFVMQK
ncbi:hypothetical protein EYF80_020562 [Liparis tanakae]|uniref:Uncharacterized protein n=1 Tax=Liparis tanakae TaxID=230148 RepID=A0A4Z2HVC1_9TELE|nr:hypothetical protein EYF80_020562 [Liparis tanakae]